MADRYKLLKQGAEAKVYVCNYLGRPTIIKERFKKTYRHPDLDTTITKERINSEVRSIIRCKSAGIRTPAIYLVDFERRRIYMEQFEKSVTVKDFIRLTCKNSSNSTTLNTIAKMIGETVKKMHDNNIIHGDLTTSNMLLVYKTKDDSFIFEIDNFELAMIDFGLSNVDARAEFKGVDLYVLERAVISTHNDVPEFFPKILEAYKSHGKKATEVISKFEEVRARGRKRTMVG